MLAVTPNLWGSTTQGSPRAAASLAMGKRVSNIPNLAGTLEEISVSNDPSVRMLVPRGFSVRQVARTGARADEADKPRAARVRRAARGDRGLDGIFGEHGTMHLDRGQCQFLRDCGVLYLTRLVERLTLHPFGQQ